VPNGAQEHFIKMVGCHSDAAAVRIKTQGYKKYENVLQNRAKIWSKPNKVGGTTASVAVLGNLVFGPQSDWFDLPMFNDWPYPKKFWIVSEDSTLKEILIPEMLRWFPSARFETSKQGKTWEYHWKFPGTGWSGFIKSMDISGGKFESDYIGLCMISEPCEEELWDAIPARMLGGGLRVMEMTPVMKVDSRNFLWVYDRLTDEYADFFYCDMEDNCREHGVRGFLEHDNILDAVKNFSKEEREAREKGICNVVGGQIYKYNWTDNLIDHAPLPRNWPQGTRFCMVMDPHESRPPAIIWAIVEPDGGFTIVDEYPEYKPGSGYETFTSCDRSIKQLCELIVNIEKTRGFTVTTRIMDPFFGSKEYADSRVSVQRQYTKYGLFCRFPPRNYIDFGIDVVRELMLQGKFRVKSHCQNTIRAIERWSFEKTKTGLKYSERFKDFADLFRYMATANIGAPMVQSQPPKAKDPHLMPGKSRPGRMDRDFSMGI
jgi:hypothetical protein